jgi:hypothetical protein
MDGVRMAFQFLDALEAFGATKGLTMIRTPMSSFNVMPERFSLLSASKQHTVDKLIAVR